MIRAIVHRAARAHRAAPAALAGGARHWRGRGCGIFITAVSLVMHTNAFAQGSLPVPSGQEVWLDEVLLDTNPGELWVRFRFVAPGIGSEIGQIGHDVATHDMDHLCDTLAVPYVARHQLEPARVIISMADREVEFGQTQKAATQYFEAYRLENAACVWEGL